MRYFGIIFCHAPVPIIGTVMEKFWGNIMGLFLGSVVGRILGYGDGSVLHRMTDGRPIRNYRIGNPVAT